jgi:thiol-disulfide isomerase/thioredoxin
MSRMLRDWGLALAMAVGCFFLADFVSKLRGASSGEAAPDFTLVNLAGGTTSLAEYRGRTVVLNFWATWCGPCKAEIPEFSAYAGDNPDVAVLGVVVPRNEGDALASIVDRFPIRYPVLVADDPTVSEYGVDVFPTTVVVRADGTVADVVHGAIDRGTLERMVGKAGG